MNSGENVQIVQVSFIIYNRCKRTRQRQKPILRSLFAHFSVTQFGLSYFFCFILCSHHTPRTFVESQYHLVRVRRMCAHGIMCIYYSQPLECTRSLRVGQIYISYIFRTHSQNFVYRKFANNRKKTTTTNRIIEKCRNRRDKREPFGCELS